MTSAFLRPVAALAGLLAGLASLAAAEPLRFTPVDDAEVISNEGSDVNLGDAASMLLQNGDDRDREVYLKFEVSGVTGNVARARLRVFVSQLLKGDPKTPVTLWITPAGWDEATLTYGTRPAPERHVASFFGIPVIGEWMEADVTAVVRGNGTYSFRLFGDERYQIKIPSKEHDDAELHPVLVVTEGPEILPVDDAPVARETTQRAVRIAVDDTSLDAHGAAPTAATLRLGGASAREAYLAFELARVNCDVTGAKLRLHYDGGGRPGDRLDVFATANGWTQDELGWAGRPPPQPDAPLASVRLPAAPGWIEFDASEYITGTGRYSFLLRTDAKSEITLRSREAADGRPELAVAYQEGLNKAVPDVFASGERILRRYGDPVLAADGILDVTKPPYCADPTGRRDSTLAIQRALNEGRDARAVTFLPRGTYLVSDTLEGISPLYVGGGIPGVNFRRREFGCVLKGPGDPRDRPVIRLAANAPGFGDPGRPKPAIHFWAVVGTPPNVYEKSNVNFSQQIMDIAVDLGGNPGAIGVEFLACEDSIFQAVSVDATGAFAGIKDGLGSGGGMHDISVTGGRYGAYITTSQPTCSLSHATFTGQTVACVYNSARGPLVMPGAVLQPAPGAQAVILAGPPRSQPNNSSLCLVDARIELPAGSRLPAIAGNRSVYLNNVYVRHAATLVRIENAGASTTQPGNPAGWCHVREYAGNATVVYERRQLREGELARPDVIFIDGERRTEPFADIRQAGVTAASIPADLQSRHTWEGIFPYHGSPGILNARDYGATGDGGAPGYTDQYPALQAAIDDASARNRPLFLPRGVYRVSKSLTLRSNTTLVGASHVATLILPLSDPVRHPDGDFLDGRNPQPLIRTADDPAATTRLGLVGLYLTLQYPEGMNPPFATSYAVLWQAGRHSVLRAIKAVRSGGRGAAPGNGPFFVFRGHGGGKAFALKVTNEDDMTAQFTNCLFDGTREPIAIYHFQPQGASHGYAGSEIRRARNIDLFGIKYEGHQTVLRIRDSERIRAFGECGGGFPDVLFEVRNSRDFLITNITPMRGKVLLGSRSAVTEDGEPTGDLNQVLLYRRGDPNRPAERADAQ